MIITDPMLADKIVAVALEVPQEVLLLLCDRLERLGDHAGSQDIHFLTEHILQTKARHVVTELLSAWQKSIPTPSSLALSWALRGAAATASHCENIQRTELVWTGPTPGKNGLRRTDQVLLDVIEHATSRLIIVTFVAFQFTYIAETLRNAKARGASISLVVESSEESHGFVAEDKLDRICRDLTGIADLYIWPRELRERDEKGNVGSMHVKCAVADRKHLLISSANLTTSALNLNMELGIYVTGGTLPALTSDHFDQLLRTRVLQPYLEHV